MSANFDALKNNRKSSFDKLTGELNKLANTNPNAAADDHYWKPDVDKAGNGYAVIRFLPAPQGEDVPFVRIWDHGFQGPGGWYIEKSLTTLGQPDPASEYNGMLWNSGVESSKDLVRKQKRRLSYYSNIYVVSDPNRPQNEGKIFIYKYGKKIFDKINEAMHPQFPGEAAVNPFDLWEGANFKLKIRKLDGYQNYDKSEFDTVGPLLRDDEELKKIWEMEYPLQELLDPKNFKSYSDLKARLEKALMINQNGDSSTKARSEDREESFAAPQKSMAPPDMMKTSTVPWGTGTTDDDDEDLSFFKKLATSD